MRCPNCKNGCPVCPHGPDDNGFDILVWILIASSAVGFLWWMFT